MQVALYDRRRAKHTSRYNAPESEAAWREAASSSETSDRYTPDLDQLYMGACSKVAAQNRAESAHSVTVTVFYEAARN